MSATVYFRVHYRDLTLLEVCDMIAHFSGLVPGPKGRLWAARQCNETLLHLVQMWYEKLSNAESIDPGTFSQTIRVIGRFGKPFQQHCAKADPDNSLWKLADLATSLVPSATPEMIVSMLDGFAKLRVFRDRFLAEVTLYTELNIESFAPWNLIDLLDAYRRLRYEKTTRLMGKISHAIIPRVHELSPDRLARLLWIISSFRWKHTTELNDALLKV